MSADFVVESSLSNRKQNGMLPEDQHLVQEDQAQDKDDDQSGEGLQNADDGNGLVSHGGIHLGGGGGDPEEVIVAVEDHHTASGAGQHGDDAAHGAGEAQQIQLLRSNNSTQQQNSQV